MYHGYKATSYYWEFIIMLKKLVMIFIKVFMATQGKVVQALVCLLFLIIFMASTIAVKPFYHDYLNFLEIFSLIISAATIYLGVYFLLSVSQIGNLDCKQY